MQTKKFSISVKPQPSAHIAIVRSLYYPEVTGALLESVQKTLSSHKVKVKNITITESLGAMEIPYLCQKIAQSKKADVIIALGCIIKGETPHFDFIASMVSSGIMETTLRYGKPIIFGILTTNNLKQAHDRIRGGKAGDKGVEAALAALKILETK